MSGNETARLMAIYFANFSGEIKPSRGQVAGQLQHILKETTADKLEPLVMQVALDGVILTRNTLLMAAKKVRELNKAKQPTPAPPDFNPDDYINPFAVPMPDYVREVVNSIRYKKPIAGQETSEQG